MAAITPVCVTVPPTDSSVTAPAELIPATAKPVSSLNESVATCVLSASSVVTALFCVPSVNVPPAPSRVSVGVVIAADCVTVPAPTCSVAAVVAVRPAVFTVPMAKPVVSWNETVPVLPASVVIGLSEVFSVNVPPAPSNSRPAALITADCVTVPPADSSVMFPVAVAPATAKPVSSLNESAASVVLFASSVVTALFCVPNVNVPPVPSSVSVGVVIAADCVTVPVDESVAAVVAVSPAVFTVPIAKPVLSWNETVPVLPASVVIALFCVFSVNVPPVPSNSRPAALITADCVTVPVVDNVMLPVAVAPATAKPLSSRNDSAASVVLFASSVVTSLF